MNIFYLDHNPILAAQYCNNSHCVKMICESAQMLANCYSQDELADSRCPRTQTGRVRRHSHYNHPCSRWVRASLANFNWLVQHAIALCDEYHYRYGKQHFASSFIYWCMHVQPNIPPPTREFTPVALAMPEEFKKDCPVESYRTYYMLGKSHIAKWTRRGQPTWYVAPKESV